MEVVILPDAGAVARAVADQVQALLTRHPGAVLGLATGSSPQAVYAELVARHRDGGLSFARAAAFLLDEYVGLPEDHPERYRNVIARDFTDHVDLDPARVHGPDGTAADLQEACADYEARIRGAGGVDLQLLGVGTDGHIAFNEPTSSLTSRTRVKTLTTQTRADNARFFGDDPSAVPRHCLTQGLGTITEARHLVLIATGAAKAGAVHQAVEGPLSARWPATVLQLHPRASVYLDEAAASGLELAGYYREVQSGKSALPA